MKEMEEKNEISEKKVYTCLCKCQVLLHVWLDEGDVELISTVHTAKIVKTENKNQKDENMKPEITDNDDKFTRGMDRADQMVHFTGFILDCVQKYQS
jgi:hypothetical protein